ncbi:MAG TPA: sensor domain-containing diguanylate cyclase [Gemmatimonadaceae bacterium]|jgi:diguanylate cyclase (GGDEF)-like protein|nr:sensor domain-containing diguanylate cyclase [Gemmatimonadaceae bacterium]
MLLAAALLAALAAIAVAAAALRQTSRARQELESTRKRLARIEEPPKSDAPIDAKSLRREVRVSFEAQAKRDDRASLAQLLVDFRDLAGAEEAIFWRWQPDRDSLAPGVWSSDTTRPAFFSITEWAPLVQWSAEGGVVQTVGQEEIVHVGAAPVRRGDTLMGVLSLTHRNGLGWNRTSLRDWLPRLADQLGAVQELVDLRRRYGRHMRHGQALLDAVQRLQGGKAGEGLPLTVCETALDVSGARGAALVRWSADGDSGELFFATEGAGLRFPGPIDGGSIVAEACRLGTVQVLEDARTATLARALYGVPRSVPEPGSVAIIPLAKDGRTLGALVLESGDVTGESKGLSMDEARPLTVLGAVVAGQLELVWQLAEVDMRARTDPLTGLWNRHHFGEQLQRTLNEADRYGAPVSLVLVDIDHFKRVNDTWGHEAGDSVLKQVARILQDGVRAVDICVRYGGEEIAMLLPKTDSDRAVEVAERLRTRIAAQPVKHGRSEIPVTASFGVATYPETVKVRDQLFPASDKALYIAKHEGRNRVRAKPATKGRTTS